MGREGKRLLYLISSLFCFIRKNNDSVGPSLPSFLAFPSRPSIQLQPILTESYFLPYIIYRMQFMRLLRVNPAEGEWISVYQNSLTTHGMVYIWRNVMC